MDDIEDHVSSHKYFAVEELPSDDDTSDVEIQCHSDVEILATPPPRDVVKPIPPHTIGRNVPPPSWTIPQPIRPSQTFIQSRQPTSQETQSQLQLQEQIRAVIALTDSPWRRMYGDHPPAAPSLSPLSGWNSVLGEKSSAPIATPESGDTSRERERDRMLEVLKERHEIVDVDACGESERERERDRAVALEVLKERDEIVDVDVDDRVSQPAHEIIDVDAFPTPDPEVVCVDPLARAVATAPRVDVDLTDVCDAAEQVAATSVDISVDDASAALVADAIFHLDSDDGGDHRHSDSGGDGYDGLVDEDYDEEECMPVAEVQMDQDERNALATPAPRRGKTERICDFDLPHDESDKDESNYEINEINDCLKVSYLRLLPLRRSHILTLTLASNLGHQRQDLQARGVS